MKRVLCGLAAILLAGASRAGEFELKMTVEEPAGLPRKAEPASGGIPLPAGLLKKDQAFAVYAGGAELPAQILPLVVDEKGFIRWLLVDTQVDLGNKEKKELVLRAAAGSAKPAMALKVTDDASGVTVDTGRIKFAVAKDKPFSLFSSVEAGGKPVAGGGEASYTDVTVGEGKRYVADKPSSVVVEYNGPMRTTVCVKGGFVGDEQNKFLYIARITAWAGRSDVHVKYSLSNSNEQHYSWRRIKDSTVTLKLAGDPAGTVLGASKPLDAGAEAWMQQSMRVIKAAIHGDDTLGEASWLHQTPGASEPGGAKAGSGDKELWASAGKADQAEGWLLAKLGAGGVFVTDLYFVDDPPRRMAVEKGALALSGVADPLPGAKSPFQGKTRWIFDCSHLSSQYLFDFAAPAAAAELSAKAKVGRSHLHLLAPPAWYFATEALPVGKFGTQADEMAAYDKWGWKYNAAQAPKTAEGCTQRIPRWSGGDDNHYTSEQDTLDCLLLMYLRNGSRSFFDGAESWANYFMDLQTWRTDGWRWKDGGGWWVKPDGNRGPLGNKPQRAKDPVTGDRNYIDNGVDGKGAFAGSGTEMLYMGNAKSCYCHNWGEGIAEWFLLTGDRDALEAAVDNVEQNFDAQKRAFGKTPGKAFNPSRDFTRASYMANATRLCLPADPYIVETSDYLAKVYFERPNREPRGLTLSAGKVDMKTIEQKVGPKGIEKMKELGVTQEADGMLKDPKTGAKWFPVADPHTWMFPPLSRAMETYHRITGSEDALDWTVAYGQGVAHVLFQEKHGCMNYSHFLVDFPTKGWAWDRTSWDLPAEATSSKGQNINGYQAGFYPDIPARAYELCGEPFLKQRAADFWYGSTHPGSEVPEAKRNRTVTRWANCYSTHNESVAFTGKTFYIWAHEKKDALPPKAVPDLKVTVAGDKATVSFTAPADDGGGKVVRYQVKCADKPLVDFGKFLELFKEGKEGEVINGWMAANVKDEPAPQAPGAKESFTVSGVPANAKFFAVLCFDDSSNRSALSNIAEAGK
jgi:hypothetical protein